jgi:hypothetical protein
MITVEGRMAEARLYLYYVYAVLRPGIRVPIFEVPTTFEESIDHLGDDDLKLLIEEGRRALDLHETDLERIRARAVTLLTIGLAETAAISAVAPKSFSHGFLISVLWCVGAVTIILAIGGTAAIFTAQARMGYVDARRIVQSPSPLLVHFSKEYLRSLGESEAYCANATYGSSRCCTIGNDRRPVDRRDVAVPPMSPIDGAQMHDDLYVLLAEPATTTEDVEALPGRRRQRCVIDTRTGAVETTDNDRSSALLGVVSL